MAVPSLKMPQSKLEKLADDLSKLSMNQGVQVGDVEVPSFQRHGYLEKLGHTRAKWFRRFFVLRDSFLLSYNLAKSDYTVEPRAAIHLANSSIQSLEHEGKQFAILITTAQKDKFLLAAESEQERAAWIADLETSKKVTHANMIRLAVENKCLADEKGAGGIALDNSTSALAIFSNEEYIQNTPITGGAEGWLRTTGFNPDETPEKKSLLGKKKGKEPQKLYFILRDSHLLMFNGGDMLTKPRGVMFLLSTELTVNPDWDGEGEYHLMVRSPQFGDEITLISTSKKVRQRWMDALRIGSRCTYPDFCLLLKEHELLAAVTLTPRAAPPSQPNAPAAQAEETPDDVMAMLYEDYDIQGEQLDPGTQQPYDEFGMPILRNPDGKLITAGGDEVLPTTPRFGVRGEQLDPFNRPLPPGAVPMFTADKTPIGVGPDGNHYLPDGTQLAPSDAHFDAEGQALPPEVVTAADAVSANVNVAIKVRSKMKGSGTQDDSVDVLGRTFRGNETEDGLLVNADGDLVPMASARKVEANGQLVDYVQTKKGQEDQHQLEIVSTDDEGNEKSMGTVEIKDSTTLKDVRKIINDDMAGEFGSQFVFLWRDVPLLRYEEGDRLATSCLPSLLVRGQELKKVSAKKFTKKVAEMKQYEEQKAQEQNEFMDVLARVRAGKFLRQVRPQD